MTKPTTASTADATPGRAEAVAEIDVALGLLRRSMARRGLGRRALEGLGLAVEPAVVEVVDIVAETEAGEPGGVTIGSVAARLGVDPSQASRLVAEAVRSGFLERLVSAVDGRRSVLKPTAEGDALIAAARRQKRALLLAHVEGWTDEELASFAGLLSRFSALARG